LLLIGAMSKEPPPRLAGPIDSAGDSQRLLPGPCADDEAEQQALAERRRRRAARRLRGHHAPEDTPT